MSPQQILTTVMTRIVVNESTDNAKPHSMCLITILTSKKMFFFLTRVALSGLLSKYSDKLANQIARLVAIVVKYYTYSTSYISEY